jgi:8-oxo-dGTP pyrophosphatase MutT (NUDIX family)
VGELVEWVDEMDRVMGVVDRDEAVRAGRLHRIATTVCRRADGRILVHRRADTMSRFPGQYNWLVGGAVAVGESYEEAAARELAEELGVSGSPVLVFTYLCDGAISPYWLGLHEVQITERVVPDPGEIAWHAWLTLPELLDAAGREDFVADGADAVLRYLRVGDEPGSTG